MSEHFLQSKQWQNFQKSLDRQVFVESGEGWKYQATLESGRLNTRLYTPYGPTADDEKSFQNSLKSLIELGKKHKVTFVRVEPTNPSFIPILKQNGWKPVNYQQLQPEHTSIVDLSKPKEDIISNMSQPSRNILRNYHKKGLSIHKSQNPADLQIFLKFIHETAQRTGIKPHSDEYFQKQADTLFPVNAASLWYASFEGEPVAAAIFYQNEHTRYYAHAGASSNRDFRKLNAPTAIVAESIVDAHDSGLKFFDLYGISPNNDPNHPWYGFTKFKKSFGGDDVEFSGAWDFPINHLVYSLYRLQQKLK